MHNRSELVLFVTDRIIIIMVRDYVAFGCTNSVCYQNQSNMSTNKYNNGSMHLNFSAAPMVGWCRHLFPHKLEKNVTGGHELIPSTKLLHFDPKQSHLYKIP